MELVSTQPVEDPSGDRGEDAGNSISVWLTTCARYIPTMQGEAAQ